MGPWFALMEQGVQLAADAQAVIALRMTRLAAGGPRAQSEAVLMVTEKVDALAETHQAMLGAWSRGDHGAASAAEVMTLYHRKVKANRRRLSRP